MAGKQVSAGDVAISLTLIEAHARAARELMAHGIAFANTPDGLLMPGQPPPELTNRQIGQRLMSQHADAMGKLQTACVNLFAPPEPIDPIAGRIGLNGDAKHGN